MRLISTSVLSKTVTKAFPTFCQQTVIIAQCDNSPFQFRLRDIWLVEVNLHWGKFFCLKINTILSHSKVYHLPPPPLNRLFSNVEREKTSCSRSLIDHTGPNSLLTQCATKISLPIINLMPPRKIFVNNLEGPVYFAKILTASSLLGNVYKAGELWIVPLTRWRSLSTDFICMDMFFQ